MPYGKIQLNLEVVVHQLSPHLALLLPKTVCLVAAQRLSRVSFSNNNKRVPKQKSLTTIFVLFFCQLT
jgi:hypothetical protein